MSVSTLITFHSFVHTIRLQHANKLLYYHYRDRYIPYPIKANTHQDATKVVEMNYCKPFNPIFFQSASAL